MSRTAGRRARQGRGRHPADARRAGLRALVEQHRRELRVHCYRMLGSFDEAEDLVQETFLRAWRGIGGFEGRSSVRAWLYRIATNACLDHLDGRARRVLPQHLSPPSDASAGLPPRTDLPWLQPFPDRLWEPVAPGGAEPERAVVERGDIAGVAALLAEDIRTAMPPWPMWFEGRATVVAALTASWDPASPDFVGRFRMLPTSANARPAVASYVRGHDEPVHCAFAISVLRIEHGLIAEVTAFHDPGLFPAFGPPATLPVPVHR